MQAKKNKRTIMSKLILPIVLILSIQGAMIGMVLSLRSVKSVHQEERQNFSLAVENQKNVVETILVSSRDTAVLTSLHIGSHSAIPLNEDSKSMAVMLLTFLIQEAELDSVSLILDSSSPTKGGIFLDTVNNEITVDSNASFLIDQSSSMYRGYDTVLAHAREEAASLSREGNSSDIAMRLSTNVFWEFLPSPIALRFFMPFVVQEKVEGAIVGTFKEASLLSMFASSSLENHVGVSLGVFDKSTNQLTNYASLNMTQTSEPLSVNENLFASGKNIVALHELDILVQGAIDSPTIVVAGSIPLSKLNARGNNFAAIVLALSIITPAIAIVVLVVTAKNFLRPMVNMLNVLRNADAQEPPEFDYYNIREMDEMIDHLKAINLSIKESASKLERIIEFADIPIAAFEYANEGNVYHTTNFFKLLNIPYEKGEKEYMPVDQFFEKLEQINGFLMSSDIAKDSKIYNVFDDDGTSRWLEMKIIRSEKSTLGVVLDITRDVMEKSKIEYERDHDPLTHLINRRAFAKKMSDLFAKPYELKHCALLMFDLDNFKFINDTYGHDVGDEYICVAVNAARQFESDNVIISRRSGDEFVVCVHGLPSYEATQNILYQIHQALNSAVIELPNNKKRVLGASCGIAFFHIDADNFEDLYRYADFAMYTAKREQRGALKAFDKALYDKESFIIMKSAEVKRLVAEELVYYAFQPIVDLKTAEIFGYEALMRSQFDSFKSPLEIIMIACALGLEERIEEITFTKAMQAYKKYESDFGNAKIFINSLSRHAMSPAVEEKFLDMYGSDMPQVVVEFTEYEAANSEIDALKRKKIRGYGALIALDDFGRGQSGQKSLTALKPDFIKLDIETIRNINADFHRQQLIKQIIEFAHAREIRVVAEGLELAEDVLTMARLGCDFGQGFFFSEASMIPPKLARATELLILNAARQN